VVRIREIGARTDPHGVRGRRGDLSGGSGQGDRQHASAVLAGRLRDELLDPGAEAPLGACGLGDGEHEPLGQTGRDRRGETRGGILGGVAREGLAHVLRVRDQCAQIGSGEAGGHEPERGEGGETAPHVRIRVEHPPIRRAGLAVERRARIGDDHDALGGVDADRAERVGEGGQMAARLDGAAGLRAHDDRGARQLLRVEHAPHRIGVRGVDHGQLDTGPAGDHGGCEARTAHAAQHEAIDALRQELGAQRFDPRDQLLRGPHEIGPAEPDRSLGLSRATPQRGIPPEDATRHPIRHQPPQRLLEVGDIRSDAQLNTHA
jgi:hypothetical protein